MRGEGDNYPIYSVSWKRVEEFIQKLNQTKDGYSYRLPTEAEWEYSCRAGTTEDYAGSLDAIAWYFNNAGRSYIADSTWRVVEQQGEDSLVKLAELNGNQTHPVGTKQPNRFGLYDMEGNVWEWCEDSYHTNYEGAPRDGSAWLGGNQNLRVRRGGSWYAPARMLRSARRIGSTEDLCLDTLGFRIVAVPSTR